MESLVSEQKAKIHEVLFLFVISPHLLIGILTLSTLSSHSQIFHYFHLPSRERAEILEYLSAFLTSEDVGHISRLVMQRAAARGYYDDTLVSSPLITTSPLDPSFGLSETKSSSHAESQADTSPPTSEKDTLAPLPTVQVTAPRTPPPQRDDGAAVLPPLTSLFSGMPSFLSPSSTGHKLGVNGSFNISFLDMFEPTPDLLATPAHSSTRKVTPPLDAAGEVRSQLMVREVIGRATPPFPVAGIHIQGGVIRMDPTQPGSKSPESGAPQEEGLPRKPQGEEDQNTSTESVVSDDENEWLPASKKHRKD